MPGLVVGRGIENLGCEAAPCCDPLDRRFFLAKGRATWRASIVFGEMINC
jgi:hypothetical protein